MEKKDYFAEASPDFSEDNILSFYPKVKVMASESRELNELIEEGDRLLAKFQIE